MPIATAPLALDLDCRCDQWACTPVLDAERFAALRNRMMLDGFKWDPQVGDVGTLAAFAVVLPVAIWYQLSELAERLTAEMLRAEEELLHRPELLKLWTWQRAGISLTIKRGIDPGPIEPFSIGGWWYLFNFWHRISSAFRLWRNPQGGYGWFVPEASSG